MIKSITVTNYLGSNLKLDLVSPEQSGFIVAGVDGLGPGKAEIKSTTLLTGDGDIFNSARVEKRNIVMTLRFLFTPMIEDTRHLSYTYFPLKKELALTVETDRRTVVIYGYVESNEPVIFDKDEYTQISIICLNPYFQDTVKRHVQIGGVTPCFKFDWALPSTNSYKLAALNTSRIGTLMNYGEITTGCIFTITVRGAVSKPKLQSTNTYEWIQINLDLEVGDTLEINTNDGEKTVTISRGAEAENAINHIEWGSTFLKLYPGNNNIVVNAESGADNLVVDCDYVSLYEGI
jgi:hypothetical protein